MDDYQQQIRSEITAMRSEFRTEFGVLRDRVDDIGERNTKLETIVGVNDQKRGIIAELEDMKSSISELKMFQVKVITIVGVASTILQLVFQHLISK